MNKKLKNEYDKIFNSPVGCGKDIYEHLPILKEYSMKVKHITEFGVRTGNSTIGLLSGKPKEMISYDIKKHPKFEYEVLKNMVKNDTNFIFIIGDTLKIKIEKTDLLFIDTYHIYKQLKKELFIHSCNVKKYIILHDTETFGKVGEDKTVPGLKQAIDDFIYVYKEWKIHKNFINNNGLTILKKK